MTRRLVVGLIVMVLLSGVGFGMARAQGDKIIDKVDTQWEGVQAELLEVKRMSDNTVRVRWRWRNTTSKPVFTDGSGYRDFSNPLKKETYLLDPVNKKKHFVVTDEKGVPVAAELPGSEIKRNSSATLWAKFPAPPPDMQKITVVLPGTPPFEDVAIAK